jgi:hypothetical protein
LAKKLKKKDKQDEEDSVDLDVGDSFHVSEAKDEDFDLDLDSARFQGKKGQAGTRTRSSS